MSLPHLYRTTLSLSTDPKQTRWLCPLLLAFEAGLLSLIILKIPCMLLSLLSLLPSNTPLPTPSNPAYPQNRHRNRLLNLHATNRALPLRRARLHASERLDRPARVSRRACVHLQFAELGDEWREGDLEGAVGVWGGVFRGVGGGDGGVSDGWGMLGAFLWGGRLRGDEIWMGKALALLEGIGC